MKTLRIIDLNIINHIQQNILTNPSGFTTNGSFNYVDNIVNEQLKFDETDPQNKAGKTTKRKSKESKRVWKSSFNSFVYWQKDSVVSIKINGVTIQKNKFKTNYAQAKISFGRIFGESIKSNDEKA